MVKPILEARASLDRFEIMAPREGGTRASLETITRGENTIAITGNVLRDYLTDLFPILELATSAKMLSDRQADAGVAGLFEDGRGRLGPQARPGSLQAENHLRWDSLGEFCALGESFKFLGQTKGNAKAAHPRRRGRGRDARVFSITTASPGRKAGEPDNRDSHYWVSPPPCYWAEALAAQTEDATLAAHFAPHRAGVGRAGGDHPGGVACGARTGRGPGWLLPTPTRQGRPRSCAPRPR